MKKDPREYMRVAFDLFKGSATEEDLAQLATKSGTPGEFYALLYLGLYAEARKDTDKARNCTYHKDKTMHVYFI